MSKLRVDVSNRLESLDILRGFDMFWIVGGGALVRSVAGDSEYEWLRLLGNQMTHVEWEGFHFHDFIMPLFMFCTGVTIPYSIISKVQKGFSVNSILKKIIKRGILLIIIGIIYNGALTGEFVNIKYTSVLGQIGLAYMIAASIFLFTGSFRSRIIWTLGILSLIGVIQLVLPLLDIGVTPLSEPTGTLKAIIDRAVIPGVMTYDTWDSHGILGAVSASSVIMIGGVAGSILRDGKPANKRKTLTLIYVGAAMVIIGLVFSPFYPIIRRAWTVTLNVFTGGLAFLLLATIYYFIDVLKWRKGIFVNITYFFKIIGMNALTIFIINRFINFSHTSSYLVGWLEFFQGGWVIILADIILKWLLLWYLYKNRIFIRI